VEGGDDVGSRVRIAAAACLVTSGLLAAGAGATIAFAEPGQHQRDPRGSDANGSSGTGPDGVDLDRDGSTQAPHHDGTPNETRSGAKGTTPGVGPLPGGTGNQHSGKVGSGKAAQPRDSKPDPQKDVDDSDTSDAPPTTEPVPSSSTETTPPPQPGCGDDDNDDHCYPGWPWPWPWEPGQPPGPGAGSGSGRGAVEVPSGRPRTPPRMQLPSELQPPASEPAEPGVVSPVPGVAITPVELLLAPLTLPVVVAPPVGSGGAGGAGAGAPSAPSLPGTPRGVTAAPPAVREPLPARVGSNVAVPEASYRIGYRDDLRTAGVSQVAALAVPGVTGILVLTGAGGLVGYRQAKAGHAVRTGGTARFIN
jgi:hypothetical protein